MSLKNKAVEHLYPGDLYILMERFLWLFWIDYLDEQGNNVFLTLEDVKHLGLKVLK
jgi:hypothetical protein